MNADVSDTSHEAKLKMWLERSQDALNTSIAALKSLTFIQIQTMRVLGAIALPKELQVAWLVEISHCGA